MSRLARFQKKPVTKEFDVLDENGEPVKEKMVIKPLKLKNLDLMQALDDPEKSIEATKKILKIVIVDNIPDYTQEEFDNMDFSYANELMNGVMEANGVDLSDAKAKFLEEIKQKQKKK